MDFDKNSQEDIHYKEVFKKKESMTSKVTEGHIMFKILFSFTLFLFKIEFYQNFLEIKIRSQYVTNNI